MIGKDNPILYEITRLEVCSTNFALANLAPVGIRELNYCPSVKANPFNEWEIHPEARSASMASRVWK
jgi:hypothetical protein